VQDQAAFDAMAKDVEQRTAKRKAEVAAANVEKERGNAAFQASQYGEALAAYSRAIEHHRGDKAVYANRALAHIKLRNFLSAVEVCGRGLARRALPSRRRGEE
jgi:tetratricopeptide (TPR) repeat protein